ncbi:hypothetical protein GCM10018987_54580 [Streptomyces cremeus]
MGLVLDAADVDPELARGTLSDVRRPGVPVTGQSRELELGQTALAHHPVQDLHFLGDAADRDVRPFDPGPRLVDEAAGRKRSLRQARSRAARRSGSPLPGGASAPLDCARPLPGAEHTFTSTSVNGPHGPLGDLPAVLATANA